MSGSINKVILIGNCCADPDIRSMQDGRKLANIRLATNESWRDKATGERKEKAEFHTVVVFAEGLVKLIEDYVRKGSRLYCEGSLTTRKWQDRDGNDRFSTEVVLQNFNSTLVMLDAKQEGQTRQDNPEAQPGPSFAREGDAWQVTRESDAMSDEVPF